ncbi:efflux RND transporter periplasmic adaptor subunit [Cohnella zeiphila]|uniref:Efflux RND transporter periplasmic adaptor subunit n=1 Tax=Cohnella zeiphila TaxID=2761120 RepID=A0A7X0SKK8_9BACL|nr:efflux RND transporter periplasmic adaptor subunit [Cohnella zeiphila]MBB6731656.1 efflux RND transporter periplasmic adaptor subunit [Cohnella zeiphila]
MSLQIKRTAIFALAFAAAAALSGCSLLPKEEAALAPPLVKPAKENYQTVKAEKGDVVVTISGSAYFESVHTDVAQFTGSGGRIEKVLVGAGDKVKKGDVLMQLTMDDLDLQVKEQELALTKAKYALKQVRLNHDSDEETVNMAALQVQIEQLKYDRLQEQYGNKLLKADMDGEVVFVEDVKPGDLVDTYQTLAIVADPNQLRLTLSVDGSDAIKDVSVGFPAEVSVNADGKNETYKGTVVQTPSSAPETMNKDLLEKYSKTLYIQVKDLPPGSVDIGKMADVKITTKERDGVVKIPRSGLRNYLGRTFVRTLEDGDKVRETDVETGLTSQTEVEIVKGLEAGDEVILQ